MSGTTNARVPLAGIEALAGTAAAARVPLAGAEVLAGAIGAPANARIALAGIEFLSAVPEAATVSYLVLPNLPGMGWSVHKKPNFATRVATHQAGREIRQAQQQWPLWDFTLTYEALASNGAFPGAGVDSLQALMGFFLARQGQFDSFLFQDPTDCQVSGGFIADADGATTVFTLVRSLGGGANQFLEPVGYVFAPGPTAVYVGGVVQPTTTYSFTAPNTVTFVAAPATGAITADFSFYFQVRFLDDAEDFEQFMSNLWQLQELKLRSVLA